MSDELRHECAVAMAVFRRPPSSTGDVGGAKLSLLMEKQHNRGQDGAGAAILSARPAPGAPPYWIFKSASSTALADVLGAIARRGSEPSSDSGLPATATAAPPNERIFLGHLRYATYGKNDAAFCHPFLHQASELCHTVLLAGNFNLTNAAELFDDYSRHGSFPTSRSDGYLITEMIANGLQRQLSLADALRHALADADGAWTLCGMTGDGWAFATRDPHGIRPGFCYIDDSVVVVASERPAIQAAFDVPPESVKELPPGQALIVTPQGEIEMADLAGEAVSAETAEPRSANSATPPAPRPCAFERIYFSRANDADIHRERKALGAALLPQILAAAEAPLSDIFFSYIPNSARIAFHGLLEKLFENVLTQRNSGLRDSESLCLCVEKLPRFGEIAVKDAKFRTFIADAAARREFYKHVYDVTYGLVRPGLDTLVVLDDSIVRGNTMKNAILPMLDRLGPKRIVIASSAPPIRYPDCYGIDMSTLGELVAFRALVGLLDRGGLDASRPASGLADKELKDVLAGRAASDASQANPLASLYARFSEAQHTDEIARLLTPPGMRAEVKVVFQTIDALHTACPTSTGDWYFTGDYPTPGGYKVLEKALANYLDRKSERSY